MPTAKASLLLLLCTLFAAAAPPLQEEPLEFYYDKNPLEEKLERPSGYRLKIGDQLRIFLYGNEEKSEERIITVDPGGKISYLFTPALPAAGKGIDQVRREIEEEVVKRLPHVAVALSPFRLSNNYYTILGEVNQPGALAIEGRLTLLGAIAKAGGFPLRNYRYRIIDYADLGRAFLARGGERLPIDFKRLIFKGDLSQDVPILPGDYIFIPSLLSKKVYCLGEVARNFVYEYLYPATLMEVIAMAGGTRPEASSRAYVIRGSLDCPIHYSVDLHLISRGCAPDFCIHPGDIVYVPPARFTNLKLILRQALRIFVGAVAFTGGQEAFFQLEPDARLDGVDQSIFINPGVIPPPSPPPPIFISP